MSNTSIGEPLDKRDRRTPSERTHAEATLPAGLNTRQVENLNTQQIDQVQSLEKALSKEDPKDVKFEADPNNPFENVVIKGKDGKELVKANVKGGTASITTVLEIANSIYRKWMSEEVPLLIKENGKEVSNPAVDAALDRYWKAHKDFAKSYPLCLRYMIQLKLYNAECFHKYLNYLFKHPWKGMEDFQESQIDYDMILFKKMNPRASLSEVRTRRQHLRGLLEEDRKFVESEQRKKYEDMKKEKLKEEEAETKLRNSILEYVNQNKNNEPTDDLKDNRETAQDDVKESIREAVNQPIKEEDGEED